MGHSDAHGHISPLSPPFCALALPSPALPLAKKIYDIRREIQGGDGLRCADILRI